MLISAKGKFQGVWPVMVTPYKYDKSIDWECYCALLDWYIEQGVNGIFALCLSSEMFFLTPEERIAIVRAAVKRCNGIVPVIAVGSMGNDLDDHVRFSLQLVDEGVDAVMLTIPEFCESAADLRDYYLRMADRLPVMLGLYECPVPKRRTLPLDLVRELARTERFGPYKETSGRLNEIVDKATSSSGTQLSVMLGNSAWFADAAGSGIGGLMAIVVNVLPRLCVQIWKAINNGAAAQADHDILCVAESLIRLEYPLTAQHVLARQGLPISPRSRATDICISPSTLRFLEGGWRHIESVAQLCNR
ncbi:MAG TPA: dihydrodipicolinate synthase family protein [Tepidisphaeraceae bacterium]|nr:dihydrodipicolinate synthase family protein [Tepidisphaeraceae bacterium]